MTTFISVVSESSTQEALRGYPITTAGSTGTKTHFQVGPLSRQDAEFSSHLTVTACLSQASFPQVFKTDGGPLSMLPWLLTPDRRII